MAYSDNEHSHPFGVLLEFSPDNVTYTAVNDLEGIDGPENAWGKSDDTTLQSPNRVKLTTPGWMEAGQFKFTCYLHKTQAAVLYTDFLGRATYYFRVTLAKLSTEVTSGTTFVAQGYFQAVKPLGKAEQGSEEKLKVEYTVELRTTWTITAGS